jgi:hypothetical protein
MAHSRTPRRAGGPRRIRWSGKTRAAAVFCGRRLTASPYPLEPQHNAVGPVTCDSCWACARFGGALGATVLSAPAESALATCSQLFLRKSAARGPERRALEPTIRFTRPHVPHVRTPPPRRRCIGSGAPHRATECHRASHDEPRCIQRCSRAS